MEGIKQFITLDENNKLVIKGVAVISDKGVIPSFEGEFVMYGDDVQQLMVLLNAGNYLRRKEIQLSSDDSFLRCYGWSTFAVLNDEQVAEMLKKQDAMIKELREREKQLSDNVNTLEAENKALKKENDEFRQWVEKLETRLGCNVVNEPHDGSTKGALKRFFGWFKRKKWL